MTIEERLEKLEKELIRGRRFNRWLLAGLGLVIVAWIVGWAFRPGREVSARRFILEDNNGKLRATLQLDKDGPRLRLYDENGKTCADLGGSEDGPGLILNHGNNITTLTVGEDMMGLILANTNANPRASLLVGKDGPEFRLYDENGKTRAVLVVTKDGPILGLYDKNGKTRATLGINQTTTPDGKVIIYPESSLLLSDPNGKVIWMAPP